MREKVEAAMAKIRPILGNIDIALVDLNEDTVRVKILIPSCGAGMPEEAVLEILEEQFKEEVPEVKRVFIV